MVSLWNRGTAVYTIAPRRVAQLVLLPVVRATLQRVDTFEDSARGAVASATPACADGGTEMTDQDTAQGARAGTAASIPADGRRGDAAAGGGLAWSGSRCRIPAVARRCRATATSGRNSPDPRCRASLARLGERLASAPMQAALASGDLEQASAVLGRDWNHLEHAVVLPPDLEPAYAALPKSGFGRLAVAEAALSGDRAVMRVIRDGDGPRVVLAAPARAGDALAGVALVRLPLARATIGLDAVTVEDDTYLACARAASPLERGDTGYGEPRNGW